jgi:hypothetical protein
MYAVRRSNHGSGETYRTLPDRTGTNQLTAQWVTKTIVRSKAAEI